MLSLIPPNLPLLFFSGKFAATTAAAAGHREGPPVFSGKFAANIFWHQIRRR